MEDVINFINNAQIKISDFQLKMIAEIYKNNKGVDFIWNYEHIFGHDLNFNITFVFVDFNSNTKNEFIIRNLRPKK